MIRVLHLRSSGGFLGAEKVVTELGRELPRFGVESIVGVPVDDGVVPELVDRCQKLGIKTQVFPFTNPFSLRGALAIRRYVREHNIDVIHTHGYRENIYAMALNPRRIVATNHLWKRTTLKLHIYAAVDAIVMRFFHTVVGVSQPIFDEMQRVGLPKSKLKLIENGISLDDYSPEFPERAAMRMELGLQNTDFVFGMVSSLTTEKGHEYALRSLADVTRRGLSAQLVIVGDGELREHLQGLARELNIESRVVFTGRRCDVPRVLQAFSVFLMASLIEGLPMALLEAMASGLAVIATSVGDIPKLVSDAVGALIPPDDVDSLTQAMISIMERKEAVPALGICARGLIDREFSSTQMASRYAEVYRAVVANKKGAVLADT